MTPFEVLVFAVAFGSNLGLFLYFLLRSCIDALELYEHKKWIVLIYSMAPLFGIDLILSLYYGISSMALTIIVEIVISVLVGLLVGLVVYLCLIIICPCLPHAQQRIIALISSFLMMGLTAVGVALLIHPHVPDIPQQLSVESGGAAILGGLLVFSGVGVLVYLVDKYYRFKKKKREKRTRAAPKSMFDEWKTDIETNGFDVTAPSYTEVPSSERGISFAVESRSLEELKRTGAPSVVDSHIRQEGEKKITLTVEDPGTHNTYNFALYLSPQNYQNENGFEAFKLASVRRCLTANPDIYDLDLVRRLDGRELQTMGIKFWEDLADDETLIATAKFAPPPRAVGKVDGVLDQP